MDLILYGYNQQSIPTYQGVLGGWRLGNDMTRKKSSTHITDIDIPLPAELIHVTGSH